LKAIRVELLDAGLVEAHVVRGPARPAQAVTLPRETRFFVAHSWPKRRLDDWVNHAEQGGVEGEKHLQMSVFGDERRRVLWHPIRPVTPEVAGSSPVAPVKNLQINRCI